MERFQNLERGGTWGTEEGICKTMWRLEYDKSGDSFDEQCKQR